MGARKCPAYGTACVGTKSPACSRVFILAQAVKRLYPEARLAGARLTEDGFQCDMDLGSVSLTDDDLPAIEREMKKIAKENLPFKAYSQPRSEALRFMKEHGETYKAEQIEALPNNATVNCCQMGDVVEIGDGPHLTFTRSLRAFSLTEINGAYWKNDQKNSRLTRLVGTAFRNREELREYEALEGKRMRENAGPFSRFFVISFFTFSLLYIALFVLSTIWFLSLPWRSTMGPQITPDSMNVFLAFSFFFCIAFYLFAISFFFWLWRRDIKLEK